MARLNPVRGNYMLVGLDLVSAGIRNDRFINESNGVKLDSIDPKSERWVTSRSVVNAVRRSGIETNLNVVEVSQILTALQEDPKFAVRTTEEHIVHMCKGGDTPENRAFAQAEVARLEAFYASLNKVSAAA